MLLYKLKMPLNAKSYALAAAIVIIIIVIYYYYTTSSTSSTTTSTPVTTTSTTSTPTTTSTTPTTTSTTSSAPVTTPTTVYTQVDGVIGTGMGACPGTLASGYCILPQSQAISYCNSTPSCTGYGYASGSTQWMAAYPNAYQLYGAGALNDNSQWTSFINANSVAGSTPQLYTQSNGVIGTALGSCPGTLASGYCILPESTAIPYCNSTSTCAGFGQATGSTAWQQAYPNAYQLYASGAPTTNSQWTSWYKA